MFSRFITRVRCTCEKSKTRASSTSVIVIVAMIIIIIIILLLQRPRTFDDHSRDIHITFVVVVVYITRAIGPYKFGFSDVATRVQFEVVSTCTIYDCLRSARKRIVFYSFLMYARFYYLNYCATALGVNHNCYSGFLFSLRIFSYVHVETAVLSTRARIVVTFGRASRSSRQDGTDEDTRRRVNISFDYAISTEYR